MTKITIRRVSLNTNCIIGELFLNGEFFCYTLERPWKDNRSFVSCIPDDSYGAVIKRRPNHPDQLRIWFNDIETEPRDHIQIHKGELPGDSKGCILVGNKALCAQNKLDDTAQAFNALMGHFDSSHEISIKIEYGVQAMRFDVQGENVKYRYLENGKWGIDRPSPQVDAKAVESYRDKKYIVIDFKNAPMWEKLPIFGGETKFAGSKSGPWQTGWRIKRKD